MGLFRKKPKVAVCEMCGKADAEGCGHAMNHVEEVRGDQPSWLPQNLRVEAHGDYTWRCLHCKSYPAMAWPSDSGAWAGMMMHLGSVHHVGRMTGTGSPTFSMIQTGQ